MMTWQLFGMISASVFCGILFVVLLGREALSVLNGITVWIRARPHFGPVRQGAEVHGERCGRRRNDVRCGVYKECPTDQLCCGVRL